MGPQEKIQEIVDLAATMTKYLECDGSTRVLNYLFNKEGIDHEVYVGEAMYDGQVMPIHYWIRIGEWYIDNKSQMWFGDKVPQGMFKRSPVLYDGEPVHMQTTELVFHVLTYKTESYWIDLNK